jgi:hypothetical protein
MLSLGNSAKRQIFLLKSCTLIVISIDMLVNGL